jgi:HK97 family phage portal protein
MWTRAGDRSILVNDPDGFPSSTPWIVQPTSGFANPGVAWLGSDSPAWFQGPTQAAGLPQVSRALGLIADSIASMPWAVYRGRVRQDEPPWLRDPQNAQQDRRVMRTLMPDPTPVVAFRSQLMASLVMHGEAFLYQPNLDESGYPMPPGYLLNPLEVSTVTDASGRASGRFKVGQVEIDPSRLLHILGRAPYTVEGRGQGVLARHAATIAMAVGVRTAVTSAYNSGVPNGYLKMTNQGATQEQANALKAAWLAAHGNARSIAVLNATTEFQPISWSLSDLSAIEMGSFTDKDIAHAFGMSAHWLDVVGDSSTYANVQDEAISFRTFTLLPWARLVESALETWLPAGTTLKIKLEGLERANLTTRDTSYTSRLANGVMTVDEVRELEDLEPLPGGAPDE